MLITTFRVDRPAQGYSPRLDIGLLHKFVSTNTYTIQLQNTMEFALTQTRILEKERERETSAASLILLMPGWAR